MHALDIDLIASTHAHDPCLAEPILGNVVYALLLLLCVPPPHPCLPQDIESFLERSVYLELGVTLSEKWRENKDALEKFGYFDPMLV